MKKRFTEQQIVAILKEGEAGVAVKKICRKHNISDATFYTWRKKYRGMATEDIRRIGLTFNNARDQIQNFLSSHL